MVRVPAVAVDPEEAGLTRGSRRPAGEPGSPPSELKDIRGEQRPEAHRERRGQQLTSPAVSSPSVNGTEMPRSFSDSFDRSQGRSSFPNVPIAVASPSRSDAERHLVPVDSGVAVSESCSGTSEVDHSIASHHLSLLILHHLSASSSASDHTLRRELGSGSPDPRRGWADQPPEPRGSELDRAVFCKATPVLDE